jgi:glutaredoxin
MKRNRWALYALLTAGALVTFVTLGTFGAGCSHKKDDGTTPTSEQKSLPPLSIGADTPDLMLTWIDDKGEPHVEIHPADVPMEGRSLVRVIVADREDGTKDLFYVADLAQKGSDGSYATQTMSRRAWEAEIEKRRVAYIARTAPPSPQVGAGSVPGGPGMSPPGSGPSDQAPSPSGGLTVIIYGASWCHPCHEAQDYLKSKGIAVIMKDIEENPGAAAEMRQKLERSGQRGGSIPVIDVKGQILVGYSSGALDRALARARSGASAQPGTVL